MGGDRSAQPLVRWGGGYGVDEALARSADEKRKPERLKLGKARDGRQALFRRFAEADAWIEHDVLPRNARARRDVERAGKERADVGDDVDRRVGGLAIMHDDHRRGMLGNDPGKLAIALEAPDVVDDGGAGRERPGRDLGLHGVD